MGTKLKPSPMLYILGALLLFISCNETTKKKSDAVAVVPIEDVTAGKTKYVQSIKIDSPVKGDTCVFNQTIKISYTHARRFTIDSAQVFFNGKYITTLDSATREYGYLLPDSRCGENHVKIIAFHPDDRQGSATQSFVIKPDKAPRRLNFEVIKTYQHDPDASTQGLVYHDGYIYEGTGIRGKSTLRKIDLNQNKILDMLGLSSELFGEGVTIYNDKIYQITWTSRKGFVYDLKSFSLETTFNYTTQGWGITTMDNKLVMSDGTNKLYHLDPKNFNKIKTVEVYDHQGPVECLNELEYIGGHIWANVWLTDRIVVIHPESGRVVEELYLPNMLTPAEKAKIDLKEDVLNGIASNPEKGSIYVTGKHWPKLFELKVW